MNVPAQLIQFELTDLQPTFADYIQSQKDENTRKFNIQFLFERNILSLSGCTATATVTIDNVLIDQELACTVDGTNNYVTVVVDAPYSGVMAVQVTLASGNDILTMPRPLYIRVTQDIAETAQIGDNSHGSFAEIVTEVANARGEYATLAQAIAAKLDAAPGAVKTANIDDGAVTAAKLGTGAVTGAKIGGKEVKTANIDDGAVTVNQLGPGAVTLPKLGAGVVDSTLTSQGAAAEAKTTGDKINVLESLMEPYNLYDPTAEYTIINASGGTEVSSREYVINPDGTITCTAYAQYAQRLLRNSAITLPAGTYTISGKMELTNVTDTTTQRRVRCRIGINTAVKDVTLTTERGGGINVAANAAAGWFAATFDLEQAEPLSFEMIPYYAAYGGTDHPCTISDLLIITGDGVGLYSDNTAIPADLRARYRMDQLATDVDDDVSSINRGLAVQGIDNRFRFSDSFRAIVGSGVTVTRNGYNQVILNGTASGEFNIEFAFHSYRITPLTLYYQMHCSDGTATGRFWLTNGYFDDNNASHQLSPNISALNEWVKVVYPSDAVDSRTYLHVESGAVFNNTEIALFAVPSVISIDISDAIDRDVLHNTFIADYNTADYQTAVDNYNAALVATGGDTEQFLFFTDPHLAVQTGGGGGMKPITEQCINLMQAVYNAAPLSYCICGGDWLGNGDTPATAASKLSYIDGFCKKKFRNFIPVIGNHDTNYQGTARFSVDMIKNLMQKTRDQQRLYYRYDTPSACLYVFDTGTENEAIGAYQNSQLEWFANSLDTDNHVHIILTMHMVYYSPTNLQVIQPISDKILEIAAAYNARGTVAVNGTTHDYSAATGTVSFCIAGHTHFDHESVVRTIPVVLTTNTTAGNTCTFDMCLVDWAAKKLYLKRVGSGSDREVNIL